MVQIKIYKLYFVNIDLQILYRKLIKKLNNFIKQVIILIIYKEPVLQLNL
jgi:hypothetical protein